MKSPFVSELESGKMSTAVFLVQAKEIRQKKTGEPYLSLTLGDRTGDLDAKMWDNVADVMDTFGRDDFVRVRGILQVYNNRPQFTLHKLQRVDEAAVDPSDFFPASSRDPEEMLAELRRQICAMSNPHLRGLLELVFSDETVARRFSKAPAAKFIHHAYLGGLIEHVLSMCGLCRLLAAHYKTVDVDLLLTGAMLHDIGKIYELSYDRSFGYTSDGQLLGHIFLAGRMVEEKLAQLPDFPPKLRTLVHHLILSHHGSLEFGSPKLPLFPEALLLHYLDDLDAKMECMRALVEQDKQVEGHFTTYCSSLERVVLKKVKYLADGGGDPAEELPAAGGTVPADAARPISPVSLPPVGAVAPTPAPTPASQPAPAVAPTPAPVARPISPASMPPAPAVGPTPAPVDRPISPASLPPAGAVAPTPAPAPASQPAAAVAPPPKPRPPQPSAPSLFGEKLGDALRSVLDEK
jgi:3'-5' exoribonuclease